MTQRRGKRGRSLPAGSYRKLVATLKPSLATKLFGSGKPVQKRLRFEGEEGVGDTGDSRTP